MPTRMNTTNRSTALAAALALIGCGTTASTAMDAGALADLAAARDAGGGSPDGAAGQPVVEIAIRRLKAGPALADFEAKRDAFVARLRTQPGVVADREFVSFFDYAKQAPPMPPVYVGMTQYESLDAFQAAGAALGTAPEAGAFFGTFDPELFTVLRPFDPARKVELRTLASTPGQVLEIAVRRLSSYKDFNPAAYGKARDAFLALLARQPGFVAEYQWVSALDPDVVVGMTVYQSMQAFGAIAADKAFLGAAETAAFVFAYPAGGHVTSIVR